MAPAKRAPSRLVSRKSVPRRLARSRLALERSAPTRTEPSSLASTNTVFRRFAFLSPARLRSVCQKSIPLASTSCHHAPVSWVFCQSNCWSRISLFFTTLSAICFEIAAGTTVSPADMPMFFVTASNANIITRWSASTFFNVLEVRRSARTAAAASCRRGLLDESASKSFRL